jgi:hypothetical protein
VGAEIIDTGSVLGKLFPHVLLAVTDIKPPAIPVVAIIEFVVDEPLQPAGNTQV